MSSFTTTQKGIIVLTILTAILHLALGIGFGGAFGIIFGLNFLGYVALLAGRYFIPQLAGQRPLIHWAFIAYTVVTIVLYFVFNWPDIWNPGGVIDKVIEIVLVILLWQERPAT